MTQHTILVTIHTTLQRFYTILYIKLLYYDINYYNIFQYHTLFVHKLL